MDSFTVELDQLAHVAYETLPRAAEGYGDAARYIAGCAGLANRQIFTRVDDAWDELRDGGGSTRGLVGAVRELEDSLLDTALALRSVHLRYGGTDRAGAELLDRIREVERAHEHAKLTQIVRDVQEEVAKRPTSMPGRGLED